MPWILHILLLIGVRSKLVVDLLYRVMDAEYFSTLYTAYMALSESNTMLFQRIDAIEQRLNAIVITPQSYTTNSNYYAWQYYARQ